MKQAQSTNDNPQQRTIELGDVIRSLSYFGLEGGIQYENALLEHLSQYGLATLPPGAHTASQIQNHLRSSHGCAFELEPILSALRRLASAGDVEIIDGEFDETAKFRLSISNIGILNEKLRRQAKSERAVIDTWKATIRIRHPHLSDGALSELVSDLDTFLMRLCNLHSVESVSLFYGADANVKQLLSKYGAKALADILPPRTSELHEVRIYELPRFFRDADIERKNYINQRLNSVFLLHMIQLDPKCAALAARVVPGGKLFLDTNVLFRLFGLDGPELHEATKRLASLSRGLGYQLCVSPRTLQEYRDTIESSVYRAKSLPGLTPDEARAALSQAFSEDFNTHYWRRTLDTHGHFSMAAYYDMYRNVEQLVASYGVMVDDSMHDYIMSNTAEIAKEEQLLLSCVPRKSLAHPDVLEHDAHMRLLILSLRAGFEESSPVEVPYWFLTADTSLVTYDRRARPKQHLRVPFCVLTSHWMQVLRPFAAAVENLASAQVDTLDSPLFRVFKLPDTGLIQEVIGRLKAIDGMPEDVVISTITNTALMRTLSAVRDENKRDSMLDEVVTDRYTAELHKQQVQFERERFNLAKEQQQISHQLAAARSALAETQQKEAAMRQERNRLRIDVETASADQKSLQRRQSNADREIQSLSALTADLQAEIEGYDERYSLGRTQIAQLSSAFSLARAEYDTSLYQLQVRHEKTLQRQRLILLWVIFLSMQLLRPWLLPPPLQNLALSLILIPCVVTTWILRPVDNLSAVSRAVLYLVLLLGVAMAIFLPIGVSVDSTIIFVMTTAQAIGAIVSIVLLGPLNLRAPNASTRSLNLNRESPSTTAHSADQTLDMQGTRAEAPDVKPVDAAVNFMGEPETTIPLRDQAGNGKEVLASRIEQEREEVEKLASEAARFEGIAAWSEALDTYRRLCNLDPDNRQWLDDQAKCKLEVELSGRFQRAGRELAAGDWRSAKRLLQYVLRRRPNYPNAKRLLLKCDQAAANGAKRRSVDRRRTESIWRKVPIHFVVGAGSLFLAVTMAGVAYFFNERSATAEAALDARAYEFFTHSVANGDAFRRESNADGAQVVLFENFDNPSPAWWVGSTNREGSTLDAAIVDGAYKCRVASSSGTVQYVDIPLGTVSDVMIRFDGSISSTHDRARLGLSLRRQGIATYYTAMFGNGVFGLFDLKSDMSWRNILEYSPRVDVRLANGEATTFVVAMRHAYIGIFANGVKLGGGRLLHERATGTLGLALETSPPDKESSFTFDNIVVVTLE